MSVTPPAARAIRWGLLFLAAICLVCRDPYRLFAPQLWAEDGPVWLHDAYMNGAVSLLWQHTGYLQSLPRLVALAAAPWPLVWAPGIFAAAGLAVQLAPVALMLSRRAGALLPSAAARLLLVAFYIGVPNSSETYINLTDAQWHLAIVSFLLLVLPPPRALLGHLAQAVALVIGGLSGPFALFLAPIAWWHAWRNRSAVPAAIILTLTALIQASFILAHVVRQPAPLGAGPVVLARLLANQIILGGSIGVTQVIRFAAAPLWHGHAALPLVTAAAAAALILAAAWAGPPLYRQFLLYAVLILAAALASPVASNALPQWQALEVPGAGSRYYLLPILAWFGAVLVLAAQPQPAWAWPARALLLLFLIGVVSDWFYPRQLPTSYAAIARVFAAAPAGTQLVFPEDPDPRVWIYALTKK